MDALRQQIQRIELIHDYQAAANQWRRVLESVRRAAGKYQSGEDSDWTLLRLRAQEGLAHAYWIVGRWDDTLSEWEELLTIASDAGARRSAIIARLGCYEVYNATGHSRMARTCLAEATMLLQESSDDDLMVLAAVMQSSIASKSGQSGTAQQLLKSSQQAAVNLHEQPLARRAQSRAAVEEAVALMRKGDLDGSLHRLTIAIEVLGHEKSAERVEALRFVGVVLGQMGRRREALEYFKNGLALCSELGYRLGEARMCGSIGRTFVECAHAALAIHYFERGLRICDQIGARVEGAATLGKLGQAYLAEERFAEAVAIFRRDLELSRTSGNIRVLGHSHLNLGLSLSGGRTDEEALTAFREAVRCFEQVEDRANLARALMELCKTQLRLGNYAEAEHASRTALGMLQELKQPGREAQAHALVATTLRHASRASEALPSFETALHRFEGIGTSPEHAYCLFEYGRALAALDQKPEAATRFSQAVEMAVKLGLRGATTRYLEALAALDESAALGALVDTVLGPQQEVVTLAG